MVKRAKLTLDHTEVNEVDFSESVVPEQAVAPDSRNLGKMLLIAGLTIASLIIFKQKFF